MANGLARCCLTSYPPGVAATNLDDAREEMDATFRGDCGELRVDARTSAWAGGRRAGAIMVVTRSIWDAHLTGPFIIDVPADLHARGKGIGRTLAHHAIEACPVAGDRTLRLPFGEGTSDAALRIRQRLGFRPVR